MRSGKAKNPKEFRRTAAVKAAQLRRKYSFQDKFGPRLEDLYQDVLNQPVPDRFIELLKTLDTPMDAGNKAEPSEDNGEDP